MKPTIPDHGAHDRPAVLFVDDDDMVCRSMARCLERAGFSVTTVSSGEEALAQARARRFDVVVTDHNMPTMSGIDLIDRLLSEDKQLCGRVILTSGDLHTAANEAFLLRTGVRGLQKPFQLADLTLAVKTAARGGRLSPA